MCLHGAVFLHWRTEAALAERAWHVINWSALVFALGFVIAGIWVAVGLDGYRITSSIDTTAISILLSKTVTKENGVWLANFSTYPWLLLSPLLALIGAGLVVFLSAKRYSGLAL